MAIPERTVDWLLGKDNPPVRYLTLVNLLRRPAVSKEVRAAGANLMDYEVTQRILAQGNEFWNDDPKRAYTKYTGKYWQVIFLGQFLADGTHPSIASGVGELLDNRSWVWASGGQCLTANLLGAFMKLGYREHPAVRAEIEALAERVVSDGGLRCSATAYSLLLRCYMAQPKLLLCFTQIPAGRRSAAVNAAVELLEGSLMENQVHVYVPRLTAEWHEVLARQPKKEQLPKGQTVLKWIDERRTDFRRTRGTGGTRPKAGWLKFGFPLHYNSDILEAMYALALSGTPMSSSLRAPLDAVRAKMTAENAWVMENSLNGKMRSDVETKGKPSKWLTYFGHYVLNHFGN